MRIRNRRKDGRTDGQANRRHWLSPEAALSSANDRDVLLCITCSNGTRQNVRLTNKPHKTNEMKSNLKDGLYFSGGHESCCSVLASMAIRCKSRPPENLSESIQLTQGDIQTHKPFEEKRKIRLS